VRSRARGVLLAGTLGLLVIGADCGAPRRPEIRQGSKSYLFNITSDPIPPHAREDVIYTVTVRDRESGQPIETGEGRIFANTLEGARTYDGFTKAPAIGAYTAKLRFVAAGQWAIGIQFHSDSTKPLEKTEWMQDVLQERPGTN
jgi:hypothetical protein